MRVAACFLRVGDAMAARNELTAAFLTLLN